MKYQSVLRGLVLLAVQCVAMHGGAEAAPQTAAPSSAARDGVNAGALAEKLARRAIFLEVRVSPDGRNTAYMYYRGLPETDAIEFTLAVVDNAVAGKNTEIARYVLPSSRGMLDQSEPRASSAGFRWSPDGKSLVYLLPHDRGVDLMSWDVSAAASHTVLTGHTQVEFPEEVTSDRLKFLTRDIAIVSTQGVAEKAMRMKEGYRFFAPFSNPGMSSRMEEQSWTCEWSHCRPHRDGEAGIVLGKPEPREVKNVPTQQVVPGETRTYYTHDYVSPDRTMIMRRSYIVSNANSPAKARNAREFEFVRARSNESPKRVTAQTDDMCRMNRAGWSQDSSRFVILEYCEADSAVVVVDREGVPHTVLRAPVRLEVRQDIREDNPSTEISPDGSFVTLVRSGTLQAEDLVSVDLKTGKLRILASPNGEQPITEPVRTVVLKPVDDVFKARLYLPDHKQDARVPLVVVLYYSSPGLEVSTGDEVAILPLVKGGVAVMTVDTQDMIDGWSDGDPAWEVARVERPRVVIEHLIAQAVTEHDIDPQRVGIAGLSYGAEISMYTYWKSDKFRAVSAVGASVCPSWVFLGGPGYASMLEARGLSAARGFADSVWQSVSVCQNARADLPPLLWQTPDSERYGTVEAWYQLRKAGAQVEWWDYPDETHEKLSSADLWLTQQRNYDWFRFWLQDYEDPNPDKSEEYVRWRAMREAYQAVLARRKTTSAVGS